MKKNKNNYILIVITLIIVISIIFIIMNHTILENMIAYSRNINGNTNSEIMIKYPKLNIHSCINECTQQTIPTKCNYAVYSKRNTCTLYNDLLPQSGTSDTLIYMSPAPIINKGASLNFNENTGYNSNAIKISTINNVHKSTCDVECNNNLSCTGYTTTLSDISTKPGTCTFYSELTRNNEISAPGTYLYTKSISR
jgi:hypothetical protein